MKWHRSIRVRFTAWYLVVLAALLVALAVGLHAFLSFTLQRSQDLALERRAAGMANSREIQVALDQGVIAGGLGEIVALFRPQDGGYDVISSRNVEQDLNPDWIDAALQGDAGFYTIRTLDGTLLRYYISRLLPPAQGGPLNAGPNRSRASVGASGTASSALPEPIVIVVGQPMDRTVAALAALKNTLWIAIPLTLLLSAGGGLFLIRRALKPIDRMIATAHGIEESDLSGRVAVTSDDELGRLAQTLNAMLGRLESAFRRQRQFTDDASHELRSPLSVIEAEATLALRKPRDPETYRGSLLVIAEESASMSHMIDQLLTLARGDANRDAGAREPVDLSELTSDTTATMSPLAEEKGVQLVVESSRVEKGAPIVIGDRSQLRRVLTNLVDNAVQHTDDGGTVTISAARRDGTIEWTVSDTGCGIPQEHLDRVFDRFYRVDATRGRNSGGSGLGLSICRQIIEAHGGTIEVVSDIDEGTTFTIRLPAAGSPGTVVP